jgi:glycosyltransferase involved in cell wall biosynthesis
MRIAINLGLFEHRLSPGIDEVLFDIFSSVAKQQPYHYFIFLASKPCKISDPAEINVEWMVTRLKQRDLPFSRWFLKRKTSAVLTRNKVDVFISVEDLFRFNPVVSNVLFVNNLSFFEKHRGPKKKRINKVLDNARSICTTTEILKAEIMSKYKTPEDKIWNVGGFIQPVFQPVEWSNKEMIKEAYADGYEYFLLISEYAEENVIHTLKAFSIFKKWQKSNMKLLLLHTRSTKDTFADQLKTFKYRDDVKVLNSLPVDEVAKVFAGAYAVLFPCTTEVFPTPVLQAMQCETPIITFHNGSVAEVGAEAVLYADLKTPADMADQMKRIYKDELLRDNLIAEGKRRAALYSLEKTSSVMWQAIQKAVSE